MSSAVDAVRAALSTTPREREYLDLDASGWSDADKDAAAAELLDAAHQGDWRVPAALGRVLSPERRREALEKLLRSAPPRVRIDAGYELATLHRRDLEVALGDALRTGQIDRFGAIRAVDLLLRHSADQLVWDLIGQTTREDTRTVLIERLWEHRGLDLYPSVWWTELGLLKRQLSLSVDSFRQPALKKLRQVLDVGPRLAGFAAVPLQQVPPELRAAMDDVERGQGDIDSALLAPLTDAQEEGLLAFAADVALNRGVARGVRYVGYLGGVPHRDLLDWAAQHHVQAYRDEAAAVLADLD